MLKLNPAYKGLTLFLISLILSFEYNYYFNFGIFLVMILLMLINKVSIKKIVLAFLPVIFLAVGVFFTGFLHSGESTDVTSLTKIVVVIGDAETGMQLAMRIMAESEKYLKNKGYNEIYLTVDPENEIAINMYKHFGYSIVEYQENEYGEGIHRYLMKKTI